MDMTRWAALLAIVALPSMAAEAGAAAPAVAASGAARSSTGSTAKGPASTAPSSSPFPSAYTPPPRAGSVTLIDEFTGTGAPRAGEPAVQATVIEDDGTRIDELRVRGQLTRIVVTSKGGAGSYEIVTGDGSRDLSDGRNTNRGAAGKRVWSVLRF